MTELSVLGVTVKFPFPPYDCQRDYISRVLECLTQKKNGVLESPTGTGKTLCLLCAALAWREHFRDSISARKISERMKGADMFPEATPSSWGSAAADSALSYNDVPKIIYASRTHSQLAQVIAELRNTAYRPKVCVLGSREQLCIHPEVMRQESNHVKVHMCRAKVSTRSCSFYNNVEEKSTDRELVNSILDVEDLVKYGTKQRVCPYYLSRSLKQQADLIFMPYNYLLDPKSRRAHNIELSKAVVIFDEAHNVERTCEEATSFDLTPYDVASAITAVDRLLADQAREVSRSETISESFSADASGLKIDISTIAKIKQILLDLETAIDSYDVPDRGITKPGIFIYELLDRAHLNYSTKSAVSEALEQISGHLAGQPGVFLNTSGLQKLSDIIQLVFCGEPAEKDRPLLMQANTAHFKVHIHQDQVSKKKSADPWSTSAPKKQGNVLSYWCFCPGFSMQELVNQGVHCIILTSGTLSPLSSFTAEMRIDFPIRLENDHVIQRDQIFVSVVDSGPDGVQLTSAFDRRFLPENMASLGSTIANLSRVVPDGLLVFFPSFPLMEKTLEFWRDKGQAERIEKIKPMFVESKGKGTFAEVIEGFYSKVNDSDSKGGSFFAVCRGKASEGLDFADSYGRGVIITGLPFPPKMDPRVILKMQFLDEMCRSKTSGVKHLSGQDWYRQQAFRAVNQAVGRVIRHKEDFGAIFLCDQRFKSPSAISQLPKWVRPYVRTQNGFGNVVRDVSQFFRVAQKMRPSVKKKPVKSVSTERAADSSLGTSAHSTQAPHSSWVPQTRQAKAMDAHIPSLKRRRVEDGSEAHGLLNLCLRYESGGQEGSLRRPTSLLDALEQQTSGGATEPWAGEEKAERLSTLSLQHDKRMEEEQRGGKRKIKLVQEQKQKRGSRETSWEENKASRAKNFLSEMRRSLSHVTFERMVQALQSYKSSDQLGALLTETTALAEDENTHSLLRGFYQFIRPHHKQQFDEHCSRLTGQGCGFKPEHTLSKEEKLSLIQQKEGSERPSSSGALLDTQQLNQGAAHLRPDSAPENCNQLNSQLLNQGLDQLTHQGLTQTHSVSGLKPDLHVQFVADLKKALGPEAAAQLFQAVRSYKHTDDYERLVQIVVSLLTDTDQLVPLLVRFGTFIRPHHKTQFKELLKSLIGPSSGSDPHLGSSSSPAPDPAPGLGPGPGPVVDPGSTSDPSPGPDLDGVSGINQSSPVNASPAVKKQSKISTFFPNSQRK